MSLNTQVADNTLAIQSLSDNAKSISQLPAKTTALDSADVIALQDTSGTFRVTLSQIETFIGSGGATTFLGLTDTPANYNLKNGQNVKVNTSGNGLEFTPDYKDFDLTDENTAVQTGTSYSLICNRPFKFVNEFVFSVNTAPTGSSIIIDVRKNGTTVFTQFANIEAGEKSTSTSATPGLVNKPVSFDIGDSLAFRVTQVGSSLPGAGMRCTMIYNVPYIV